MGNSSAKGNAAELDAAAELMAEGYIVGSRRHIGGAGDLLALRFSPLNIMLVEVKQSKGGRYENFRRVDRLLMLECAYSFGFRIIPVLFWRPRKSAPFERIPHWEWPSDGIPDHLLPQAVDG